MFRRIPKLLLIVLIFSLFSARLFAGGKSDDIVILFTNDVHCAVSNYVHNGIGKVPKYNNSLGYAKVASYKKQMQKTHNNVFLVDAGDNVHGDGDGQALAKATKGESIIRLMNDTGYDYVVLGNHEFIYGVEQIRCFMEISNAEYLGCNIIKKDGKGDDTLSLLNTSFDIRTAGDVKIAFIGITTPESVEKGPTGDYEILDGQEMRERVQSVVNSAKESGADYVVVIGHIGLDSNITDDSDNDRYTSEELINDTRGIDIFIDGHSPVGVGEKAGAKKQVNNTGFFYNKDKEKVYYGHTGKYGKRLGKIVITPLGAISITYLEDI